MNSEAVNSTGASPRPASRAGGGVSAALYMWDLTVWHDQCEDRNALHSFLRSYCKKFVYQLEQAETGERKKHWQCRVSLTKKKRKAELLSVTPFPNTHVTPTSSNVHEKKSFNYAMKADTKVDGPWSDEDVDPPPLTRQLKKFIDAVDCSGFRLWQQKVLDYVRSDPDDRGIFCVIDKKGNGGKSVFVEYMEYHQLVWEIPFMNSVEDVLQCVMSGDKKGHKAYCMDMPRALKKDKLAGLYGGLECLKNGMAYDKRYAFKKRRFDRPHVIVFTNEPPEMHLMSRDRWEIFCIDEVSMDLVSYEEPVHDNDHYLHVRQN